MAKVDAHAALGGFIGVYIAEAVERQARVQLEPSGHVASDRPEAVGQRAREVAPEAREARDGRELGELGEFILGPRERRAGLVGARVEHRIKREAAVRLRVGEQRVHLGRVVRRHVLARGRRLLAQLARDADEPA